MCPCPTYLWINALALMNTCVSVQMERHQIIPRRVCLASGIFLCHWAQRRRGLPSRLVVARPGRQRRARQQHAGFSEYGIRIMTDARYKVRDIMKMHIPSATSSYHEDLLTSPSLIMNVAQRTLAVSESQAPANHTTKGTDSL